VNRFEHRWQQRGDNEPQDAPPHVIRIEQGQEVPQSTDEVWALLTSVADAPLLYPTVERGFVVPGTPDGVGQQQCFISRDGSVSSVEVIEHRVGERAVFGHRTLPIRSTIDLHAAAGACRVVLGLEVDVPAGSRIEASWEGRSRTELLATLRRLQAELGKRHPQGHRDPGS